MQHKYDIATAMRLYFIAGSQDVTHFASDPADNLLSVLEQALQAGITCYQFREKGKERCKILSLIRHLPSLVEICAGNTKCHL